jgi:hypothetical protein
MLCRHCSTPLQHTFLDLGFAPPSNAYLEESDLVRPEVYLPLRVMVCDQCWLVQTQDYAGADTLFDEDYAYFSSVSQSWLDHARRYVDMIVNRLGLTDSSRIVEIAANDGYLLRNFRERGIPCLGIEPTAGTAAAARDLGIPVVEEFFGADFAHQLVSDHGQADLIIGNNVFAHVPDINDFSRGVAILLDAGGTVTLEFPHLLRLIEFRQFDTVYHEHFSYLSLVAVDRILQAAGLRIFDVEELPTHGGSLRVYACHHANARDASQAVDRLLERERAAGLESLDTYQGFQQHAENIKNALLTYLLEQKRAGKMVAAYGAAAKGNTLLNYAGIKSDLVRYVCDNAASKQGKYMPGSHIPICAPSVLETDVPDVILILPWNIADEIVTQAKEQVPEGCSFVTAIPELRTL